MGTLAQSWSMFPRCVGSMNISQKGNHAPSPAAAETVSDCGTLQDLKFVFENLIP